MAKALTRRQATSRLRTRPDCVLEGDRPREWLEILAELSQSIRVAGRLRLLESWAALAVGDFERIERILAE